MKCHVRSVILNICNAHLCLLFATSRHLRSMRQKGNLTKFKTAKNLFLQTSEKVKMDSLCSYPLPHNIPLVNKLDCDVTHDEADITLCSYMLKAAAEYALRQSESSVMTPTSLCSWCTGHRGCELLLRFKWKSGMEMSWTSTKLFGG